MRGYHLFTTAIGRSGVGWTEAGIVRFVLPDADDRLREELARADPPGTALIETAPPAWIEAARERIVRHLDGELDDLSDLPLDLRRMSEFLRRVYAEARLTRPGTTTTYGELAARCDAPGAARAVGRAMGHNPIPLIVPCHRVLAAAGDGGFSAPGGLTTKDRLLAIERAPGQARLPLD